MSNTDYIPFYTSIWRDGRFKSLPSADAQLLFINLWTNDSVSLTGIYQMDKDICKASAKRVKDFETCFEYILNSGMVQWDEKTEFIWIVNRFKLIPYKSSKVVLGAVKELNMMEHEFKNSFLKRYNDEIYPFRWALKEYKLREDELMSEEMICNIAKIYNSRKAVKKFLFNRGIKEEKIDEVMNRVLPGLKP